jgi:AcrR family transcriptional regulator
VATNRVDRRVSRTRRQLKDSLFALILEKGYDAVTIEDITERADLGRTTFYLHYHDKEELLLESIKVIAQDLLGQIAPLHPLLWDEHNLETSENHDPIRVTFAHAAENAQLYQIILRGEGAIKASTRVHGIISETISSLITRSSEDGSAPVQLGVPLEIFSNYLAGALTGLLTWWLETGMCYTPEEMSQMFRKMFFLGGRAVLTQNST